MIWFALSCTHAYMFRFYSYLLFLWNLRDCWIHNKCMGLHGNLSFLMADKKTRTWSNLLLLSRKNVIAYAHDGKFSNKQKETFVLLCSQFGTVGRSRDVGPKSVPQLFLGLLLGTPRSARSQIYFRLALNPIGLKPLGHLMKFTQPTMP